MHARAVKPSVHQTPATSDPIFVRALVLLTLPCLVIAGDALANADLRANEARIERHILELASFGANP